MKRVTIVLALCLFSALGIRHSALAQVPQLINYQGRLLDGTNLVNGTVGLSLRLFNVASGGSAQYEDSNDVAVADGLYATILGDNTTSGSLVAALTNEALFIEVAVNDVALAPRERVASAPFALATREVRISTNLHPSVVVAGGFTTISNPVNGAAIIGGFNHSIADQADYSAILGGMSHRIKATGQRSTILGGLDHVIDQSATDSSLVGGFTNFIGVNARVAVIAGGQGNRVEANSFGGFIAGGTSNAVAGRGSQAGGNRAKATNGHSFVWADGTAANFGTTTSNQFLIRASGGVGIGTNATAANGLTVAGPLSAASLSGNGAGLTNLGSASLADGAVTSNKLAADSVTGAAVADGSLSAGDLGVEADPRRLYEVSQPRSEDSTGSSLALFGTNAFLWGAPQRAGVTLGGSVFLISRGGTLQATFTNPVFATNDQFGFAVAGLGTNRFAVGTPDQPGVGGAVFLFQTSGLVFTIPNPAPIIGDRFGAALSAFGTNRLAIGAPADDTAASDAGAVYIYDASGSLLQVLLDPAAGASNSFGTSLAWLDASHLAIGAPGVDGAFANEGRTWIIDLSAPASPVAVTNPTPGLQDQFGRTLAALDSGRLAVGVPLDDAGAANAGVVHVFTSAGALTLTVTNPAPAADDQFGASLSPLGPDRFLVGAPNADGVITNRGAVYLYDALIGRRLATAPTGLSSPCIQHGAAVLGMAPDLLLDVAATNAPFIFGGNDGSIVGYALNERVPGLRAETVSEGSIGLTQLDQNDVDSRYVNAFGDFMTGGLHIAPVAPFSAELSLQGSGATGRTWYVSSRPDGSLTFYELPGGKQMLEIMTNGLLVGRLDITTNRPAADLHVFRGAAGAGAPNIQAPLAIESDTNNFVHLLAGTNATQGILFGSPHDNLDASLRFNNNKSRELTFRTLNSPRMIITSNGLVGIATTSPTSTLHVAGTITCTTLNQTSDRNAKENIQPVDAADVLARVAGLPVATWNFKGDPAERRHIGPMAQDFHAAFGVGDNEVTISAIDPAGVALAAIQALAEQDRRQRTEDRGQQEKIRAMEQTIIELRARLEVLEAR